MICDAASKQVYMHIQTKTGIIEIDITKLTTDNVNVQKRTVLP